MELFVDPARATLLVAIPVDRESPFPKWVCLSTFAHAHYLRDYRSLPCQRVAVVLALGCVFLGVLKASDLLLANTCIKVELFILHGEQFYLLSGVASLDWSSVGCGHSHSVRGAVKM